MATASPTLAPRAAGWRDSIRITRLGIFSIAALLFGGWLLVNAVTGLDPDTVTRLTFGANLPELLVPTRAYAIAAALIYLLSGAVGLSSARPRIRKALLLVSGLLIIPTILVLAAAGTSTNVTVMLQVSVRLATPIVMGALAGIWCERSGVINIAIEGMMLTGACFGFVAFTLLLTANIMPTSSALFVGVIVAALSGGLMATLHAWLSLRFNTDQIVSGTVINLSLIHI